MEKGMTVRKIVIAGVLGAVAILLGVTRLGFIPVPTAAGNATIMHVPAVIGGIMQGPVVGLVIGLIFGVSSFLNATIPLFKDPLVAILPRLLIGVFAYFAYVGLRRWNEYVAIGVGGLVGSLTNTILVVGLGVLRGYIAPGVGVTIVVTNGIPEAIVSIIVTLAVVVAWKKLGNTGKQKSKISGDL